MNTRSASKKVAILYRAPSGRVVGYNSCGVRVVDVPSGQAAESTWILEGTLVPSYDNAKWVDRIK